MAEKIIILTGASGGLGTELLHYFHSKPEFRVVALYHHHPIQNYDGLSYQLDLSNLSEIEQFKNWFLNQFTEVFAVIHAAGISESASALKTNASSWRNTFAINTDAPFFLTQQFLPHLANEGGSRIIFLSSVVAQTGVFGTSAYAASKAALFGLTKTLSKELAKHKHTVNTLALGYFDAGMISDVPEDMKSAIIDQIPMKSLGDPLVIAEYIQFLMSERANYITGQILSINGGLYA